MPLALEINMEISKFYWVAYTDIGICVCVRDMHRIYLYFHKHVYVFQENE